MLENKERKKWVCFKALQVKVFLNVKQIIIYPFKDYEDSQNMGNHHISLTQNPKKMNTRFWR
jgi:hypothetical protein